MTCKCEHWQICHECEPKRFPNKVAHMPFKRPVLTDLRDELKAAVFKYEGRITLAEAIVLLDIVKAEMREEHQ